MKTTAIRRLLSLLPLSALLAATGTSQGATRTAQGVRVGEGTLVLESSFWNKTQGSDDYQTETGWIPFLILREGEELSFRSLKTATLTWTETFASKMCSFEMEAETVPAVSGTVDAARCKIKVTISGRYTSGRVKSQQCPGPAGPVWPGGVSQFGPYELDLWSGAHVDLGASDLFRGKLTLKDLWLDPKTFPPCDEPPSS